MDGEGIEAEQDGAQFGEGVRDGGGDDDEGEGEAEDDVGEVVDARGGEAAQTEAVLVEVGLQGGHCGDSVRERGFGGLVELDGADETGGEGEEGSDELEYAAYYEADETER